MIETCNQDLRLLINLAWCALFVYCAHVASLFFIENPAAKAPDVEADEPQPDFTYW